MRTLLMVGAAVVIFAGAARADAIYNFRFTSGMQLDAEGTFTTGATSPADSGYFLLTDITFTALRDNGGTLDAGTLEQTGFHAGSAYNPTTGAFIGLTEYNYGGGDRQRRHGAQRFWHFRHISRQFYPGKRVQQPGNKQRY